MSKKPDLQNLINNLHKYKDAVVVVGDKAVSELNLFQIDESSKNKFNRKEMVKSPKSYWKYYKENVYNQKEDISEAEEAINDLILKGVVKTVVNLNYTGNLTAPALINTNVINLKGDKNKYRCMSCNKEGYYTEDMLNTLNVLKCDCKGKIAPTVTMFEEKYLEKHVQAIKDSIFDEQEDGSVELKTHALIFIGVDFEEDYMHELIESYSAIKNNISTEEDTYYCIMIAEKDGVSIEYYQPEFATYENIAESIKRLTNMI